MEKRMLKHTAVKVIVLFSFLSCVAAVKCEFLTFSDRHGLARSGTEYGPLTDLPDWSFAGKMCMFCFYYLYGHLLMSLFALWQTDDQHLH